MTAQRIAVMIVKGETSELRKEVEKDVEEPLDTNGDWCPVRMWNVSGEADDDGRVILGVEFAFSIEITENREMNAKHCGAFLFPFSRLTWVFTGWL